MNKEEKKYQVYCCIKADKFYWTGAKWSKEKKDAIIFSSEQQAKIAADIENGHVQLVPIYNPEKPGELNNE